MKKSVSPDGVESDLKKLISEKEDFILSEKYDNSLAKLVSAHPDGVPDRLAASVLMVSETELQGLYDSAVKKLRTLMGVG